LKPVFQQSAYSKHNYETLKDQLTQKHLSKLMFLMHSAPSPQIYQLWGHPFMLFTRRGVRLRWVHADGGERGGRSAPCGRPHRKLEPTDVILYSSYANKLEFLYQNFVFGRNGKWKYFININ